MNAPVGGEFKMVLHNYLAWAKDLNTLDPQIRKKVERAIEMEQEVPRL